MRFARGRELQIPKSGYTYNPCIKIIKESFYDQCSSFVEVNGELMLPGVKYTGELTLRKLPGVESSWDSYKSSYSYCAQ